MTNQDLPNTVDPAKADLWKAMGYPRWDLLPVEPMEKESSLRIATRHLTNFIRRFLK